MQELWKSAIPIISSSKKSQVIIISTPNGVENKFYELYQESQKEDPEWHLERVDWWEVPGRDENWKDKEIKLLGSKETFDQEYGNVFHEKGKSAIDAEVLARLKSQCKEPIFVMDNGFYKVFMEPNPSSFYAIGVDVGEGIGRSNTVAQILDLSDLTSIKQVAIFASNTINPFSFGTRLMGILEDWGRPPILIENNNNGQQVLDVLCHTHNYESVITYQFDGMSKHYNKEYRFGIHNHTNTRYRGITNFRYWANTIKSLNIYDIDTLMEMTTFVKNENFTFSKRKEEDLDDRVFALIWGLFILDPSIASKYYTILESDDQGKPLKIRPNVDNSDLIKKSPIYMGQTSTYKRMPSSSIPTTHVGKFNVNEPITINQEKSDLLNWLMRWGEPPPPENPETPPTQDKLYGGEEYRPIMLF
jgi:hypothetical protein